MEIINNKKYTKAQNTRAKVLKTTLELFREKGYANTTIRDVCTTAGVSIGTFYNYFQNKEDILSDIFKSADEYFQDVVSKKITGKNTVEKIEDYFKYYAKLTSDSGIETMKILYNSDNTWFIQIRPMQKVLEEILLEGQTKGEIISDISAMDITTFLFILARGCCYSWCILNGSYNLENQLRDYILRALKIYEIRKLS